MEKKACAEDAHSIVVGTVVLWLTVLVLCGWGWLVGENQRRAANEASRVNAYVLALTSAFGSLRLSSSPYLDFSTRCFNSFCLCAVKARCTLFLVLLLPCCLCTRECSCTRLLRTDCVGVVLRAGVSEA